jgi:hypothetical protein
VGRTGTSPIVILAFRILSLIVVTGNACNNLHDDAVNNVIDDFIGLRVQDGKMAQDGNTYPS